MKRLLVLFALLLASSVPSSTSSAQGTDSLVVLFTSEPGVRPAFLNPADLRPGPERFDANGDGHTDLVLVRDNNAGQPQALRVVDGTSNTVLFQIANLSALCNNEVITGLYGFANLLDESTPYLLVTSADAVFVIDASTPKLTFTVEIAGHGIRLAGVTDLTGDGTDELIIFSPETRQITVWGEPHIGN